MNELTRLEIFILLTLYPLNKITAATIRQIGAELEKKEKYYKKDTIYRNVKILLDCGFITEGIQDGRAKTYFLTQAGKDESSKLIIKVKGENKK